MKTRLMFFTVSCSRQTPQSEVISEDYNLRLQSAGAGMLLQLTATIREKA